MVSDSISCKEYEKPIKVRSLLIELVSSPIERIKNVQVTELNDEVNKKEKLGIKMLFDKNNQGLKPFTNRVQRYLIKNSGFHFNYTTFKTYCGYKIQEYIMPL